MKHKQHNSAGAISIYGKGIYSTDDKKPRMSLPSGVVSHFSKDGTRACLVRIIERKRSEEGYDVVKFIVSSYDRAAEDKFLSLDPLDEERIEYFSSHECLTIDPQGRINLKDFLGEGFEKLETLVIGNGDGVIVEIDTRNKRK